MCFCVICEFPGSLPDSLTSIGEGAFEGCSALTTVTLPDSLTAIGDGAFCDCPLDAELHAAVRAINPQAGQLRKLKRAGWKH